MTASSRVLGYPESPAILGLDVAYNGNDNGAVEFAKRGLESTKPGEHLVHYIALILPTFSQDAWPWRGQVKRQLTVKAAVRRNVAEYVSECIFARGTLI